MKKILITYLNTGELKSHMEKEAMWFKLTSEYGHLAKTRVISMSTKKLVEFEDGTIIEMIPVNNIRGVRATHVYASSNLVGEMQTLAMMAVMEEGNLKFDTEGKTRRERFKTFSTVDGKFQIT